jgi:hypothetical protein
MAGKMFILCVAEQSPGTSNRRFSHHHHISHQTVVRVLHYQLLYLLLILQALQLQLDHQHQKALCKWLLQQDASPTFLS